jgi:hypothetical protein
MKGSQISRQFGWHVSKLLLQWHWLGDRASDKIKALNLALEQQGDAISDP